MIHLVSFATPQFRHRQIILGLSGRLNRVVDTVTDWTPRKLQSAGFGSENTGIKLSERGSGFWSWKPFIITRCLENMTEGEILLYCDVGRVYPFKLLDQPLDPFVRWMDEVRQDVMPGIEIPWNGPAIRWTKRDALVALKMDHANMHCLPPVQASFSLWRVTEANRALASEWMRLCADRQLVSDDPSRFFGGEHPEFREHRHDQALWTLLCRKRGIRAIKLGFKKPPFDEKHPSEVARYLAGPRRVRLPGRLLHSAAGMIERLERCFRNDPSNSPSDIKHLS